MMKETVYYPSAGFLLRSGSGKASHTLLWVKAVLFGPGRTSLVLIGAVLALSLTAGCAARTHVTSEPEGATISLNGEVKGVTPLTISVPTQLGVDSVYAFTVEKKGYQTESRSYAQHRFYNSASRTVPNSIHFYLAPEGAAEETENASEKRQVVPTTAVKSDIDKLPQARVKERENAYAIVIGIEYYRQKLPHADFATQDAQLVTEYLTKVLGYPEENVVTLLNDHAAKSDFEKYFEKWLANNVEKGGTVFVYYWGHGAPDPNTGAAYLVPYDGDPSFIDQTGYSLRKMYDALGKLPAKEVVVALDSCFSGAGGKSVLAKGARPLVLNLQSTVALSQNMVVLAAASGEQVSVTYNEKGHGLFTYYMLKGIKNENVAKPDGSLDITALYDYLKPLVVRTARKMYNNEQTPQLIESKKK